jgi:hypothetical protein
MSIPAINWAWKQRVGKPSAKLVLAALADYASEDGKCWPSLRTLATRTELSRDTVLRAIRFLKSKNLIIVIRRGTGKSALSNLYQLNYKPERLESVKGSAELILRNGSTGRLDSLEASKVSVARSGEGSRMIGPRVLAPSDTNRHIEPSIEPVPPIVPRRGTEKEDVTTVKEWLNKMFRHKRSWSFEEDQLLSQLLPITCDDRNLLSCGMLPIRWIPVIEQLCRSVPISRLKNQFAESMLNEIEAAVGTDRAKGKQ